MVIEHTKLKKEQRTKIFSNVIFKRPINVVIQTTDHKICGNVHVRPDDRLRDELNMSEPFLAVTDATIFDQNEQVLYKTKFIAVNVAHIIWLLPQDEINPSQDEK
ncbi:hypothetical protein LARV_02896 [Longilinea arvoryzae]|uniref:Uncharacterized protein n=2 Tax=Longilinea arvoryzae TaxID=360412 RepID=A0A0S7BM95_9CHLR|nr:hypothetical protein LARV_02896 [Longilinea arvoryzae]